MSLSKTGRTGIKRLIFGDSLLPQEFTIGMAKPDAEIIVWLHGLGEALDVTHCHSTACSDPFIVCIAFSSDRMPDQATAERVSLAFVERNGQRRILGEIRLEPKSSISVPGLKVVLFGARSAANYCLPRPLLCAHYLLHAYLLWRMPNTSGLTMSFVDRKAAMVTFIRAHPVSLVSVVGRAGSNIFPMNLMGDLGNGYFAFALKDSRRAAHLVEDAGRLAVSSVPIAQASLAFQLAANHKRDFVDWEQLPFEKTRSTQFGIPIPVFALRVREMEIETIQKIGSHSLFIARIVRDEERVSGEELCVIHGFYQHWRLRQSKIDLQSSLVEDAIHKGICGA